VLRCRSPPALRFLFSDPGDFTSVFAVLGQSFSRGYMARIDYYADMGHFGRVPIRLACSRWHACARPHYFRTGRAAITDASALDILFYSSVADWGAHPRGAFGRGTVIASQAIISGRGLHLTHRPDPARLPAAHADLHTDQSHDRQNLWTVVNGGVRCNLGAVAASFGTSDCPRGAYVLFLPLFSSSSSLPSSISPFPSHRRPRALGCPSRSRSQRLPPQSPFHNLAHNLGRSCDLSCANLHARRKSRAGSTVAS